MFAFATGILKVCARPYGGPGPRSQTLRSARPNEEAKRATTRLAKRPGAPFKSTSLRKKLLPKKPATDSYGRCATRTVEHLPRLTPHTGQVPFNDTAASRELRAIYPSLPLYSFIIFPPILPTIRFSNALRPRTLLTNTLVHAGPRS